jgi:Leucine-rich repeat (LRR) protein
LKLHSTRVADLSPLRGLPLAILSCKACPVSDLASVAGLPLEEIELDFNPWRGDREALAAVKALRTINGQPAAEFWKPFDAFDAWCKDVAKMPADKQVDAVALELKRRNRGFDGKLKPTIKDDQVRELEFLTDRVTDLAPVRALTRLETLYCEGRRGDSGKLVDLWPLHGMGLKILRCGGNPVADLSALRGIPLWGLHINQTAVSDLESLRGMSLVQLVVYRTRVSDLAPLKGMKLAELWCDRTQVTDLSPLRGMPLRTLGCTGNHIADPSPLLDLPNLQGLDWDYNYWRDAEVLRSLKTLTGISHKDSKSFLKDAEARQARFEAWCKDVAKMPADRQVEAVAAELKKRNPGFDGKLRETVEKDVVVGLEFLTDQVADISPVRALPALRSLDCGASAAGQGKLADLWALKGLPLTYLRLDGNNVSGLLPLRGMPLRDLLGEFQRERDAELLRSLPTLATINGRPAAEFLQSPRR